MIKKGISVLLLATIFLLSFSGMTHAATSEQYSLRPTSIGDDGSVRVYLYEGATKLGITVNQSGIHSGQQAHTYWKVYHQNTGKVEHEKDLPGDFYGAILFDNLKNPGGTYDVIWESKTNNDTQGWWLITTPSSTSKFYELP